MFVRLGIFKIWFVFNYGDRPVWKTYIGATIEGRIGGRTIGGAIGLTGATGTWLVEIVVITGCVFICIIGFIGLKIGGGTDYNGGGV
jgi:hypothetical protein